VVDHWQDRREGILSLRELLGTGPVWRNGAWAQFNAIRESFDTTYLGVPWEVEGGTGTMDRVLRPFRPAAAAWTKDLCAKVEAEHDPNGPQNPHDPGPPGGSCCRVTRRADGHDLREIVDARAECLFLRDVWGN
jgi:hypothetical protein